MLKSFSSFRLNYQELFFQIMLHILVLIFYSFDRHDPQILEYELMFFLNYAVAAFLINYILLPQFYYQKRYVHFILYLLVILVGVIIVEEYVIEKIYFPDTRGARFSGMFYILLDILPVIVILSGFKFAWDALEKQREVDSLKSVVKESELQFLKSQINPHFLFNNLNNLYSYALENSPKTTDIIVELSSVLRYMLYECKADFVPLQKEVEQLKNFISLSEMQIEERGQVSFEVNTIPSDLQIAPLILIVFIENAFKHSTASQSDNIKIDINIEVIGNTLNFGCRNSFQPHANTDNLSTGIGLENVKKRLTLLYPKAHQLDIHKYDTEYNVRLYIELGN